MIKKSKNLLQLINNKRFRLIVALASAAIIFFIYRHSAPSIELLIMMWVGFAATLIIFSGIIIFSYHPKEVKAQAQKEDTSGSVIFLFIIAAAVCSLAGIFFLLKTIPQGQGRAFNVQVAWSLASVFCSWLLVHTLFTIRYAHLYYIPDQSEYWVPNGLEFPGEKSPDYLDFAYFSFVLGMTFQVSDVQIASRQIRRLALLHGCLSFLYNTIILALSINIVSGWFLTSSQYIYNYSG